MLFNSPAFAFFFPIAFCLYFLTPPARRWMLLLAASCCFYMYFIPRYIWILAATITVDYCAAIYIEDHSGPRKRTALITSIVATCLILAVFKYARFFAVNAEGILRLTGVGGPLADPRLRRLYEKTLQIVLPIGLSFHTFQSLSYVIEVYRGRQKAERHFGIYALYVMFFPQLVAGPIERPQNLLHQFHEVHALDYERIRGGLLSMAVGLFMKVVIADRLAIIVNRAYGDPASYSGLQLLIGTIFFAFQIYCDFAGYSLIALGSAEMLGFKLMRNFRRPYLSSSVSEFWQRWHISLSTWFKDYVYVPLGGNRGTYVRWQLNLLITFLISGLWHGANWTYVAWGALNGIYLILENAARARFGRLERSALLGRARTFVLIAVSWILFRAGDMHAALQVFLRILRMSPGAAGSALGTPREIETCAALIAALTLSELVHERSDLKDWLLRQSAVTRWTVYHALAGALLCFGVYGQNQFIYFQF